MRFELSHKKQVIQVAWKEYSEQLKKYCETVVLDGLISDTGDVQYRTISLKDIYCPLRVSNTHLGNISNDDFWTYGTFFSNKNTVTDLDLERLNIEELDKMIKLLDERIAELREKTSKGTGNVSSVYTSINDTVMEIDARLSNMEYTKENMETNVPPADVGDRVIIRARPGSGKSTWCKRVCLAYIAGDESFLNAHAEMLHYYNEEMPLLLICRNMVEVFHPDDVALNSGETLSFQKLAYLLVKSAFGKGFSDNISEDTFIDLINEKACSKKLLIVVDGWDELLDEGFEKQFGLLLDAFLSQFHETNLVITVRDQYAISAPMPIFVRNFKIEQFNAEDVEIFCKKWHEVMYQGSPQKIENYLRVVEQLKSPVFRQVSYMTSSPYLLSNLLRLSRYRGRLPTSVRELYSNTIEMMIEWFTKLECGLDKNDVRIQLEYIASYMTKNKKLVITEEELERILGMCFIDLDGYFSNPLQNQSISTYVREFTRRNCVLEYLGGKRYSFPHRQMQDYLTACAIMHRTSDAEDNVSNPLDILRQHYKQRSWKDIIVFAALVGNGWFDQTLVDDLIALSSSSEENYYICTHLLFLLVLNSVDILEKDKRKIYDIAFRKNITDLQITNICRLVELDNAVFKNFKKYLKEMFTKGIEIKKLQYVYAWAVLRAKEYVCAGVNPLNAAELLMAKEDLVEFITGLGILNVLSWCKCVKAAKEEFGRFCNDATFRVSKTVRNILKSPFFGGKDDFIKYNAYTIRDCVLANYIDNDGLVESDFGKCLFSMIFGRKNLSDHVKSAAEEILSVWPVHLPDTNGLPNDSHAENVRRNYLERYETCLSEKDAERLVFMFNLCSVTGCWKTEDEIYRHFESVSHICKGNHIAVVRVNQLAKMLQKSPFCYNFSVLQDCAAIEFQVIGQKEALSEEGENFLECVSSDIYVFNEQSAIMCKNNVAYLLRRGEIKYVNKMDNGEWRPITVAELLEKGMEISDGFSLVNYALSDAQFFKNHAGDYEKGIGDLTTCLRSDNGSINAIVDWWWPLAKRGELEGCVVLLWLHELNCLHPDNIPENATFFGMQFMRFAEVLGNRYKKALTEFGEIYG